MACGTYITKWIVDFPWIWVLLFAGLFAGISTGISSNDLKLGLLVVVIIFAIGMTVQWLQTRLLLSLLRNVFDQLTFQYRTLTKRIGRLQQAEFELIDWNISHSIDENGDGKLIEEVTIVALNEPVYLYFVQYSIPSPQKSEIEIFAQNVSDNTPLDIFEVESTERHKIYMILLDPPSAPNSPKRISIACNRHGIWSKLLENGEDDGSIMATFEINSIHLEIVAPRNYKWKAFHPAPIAGESKLEIVGSISRAIWNIINPTRRRYSYRIFLEKSR